MRRRRSGRLARRKERLRQNVKPKKLRDLKLVFGTKLESLRSLTYWAGSVRSVLVEVVL